MIKCLAAVLLVAGLGLFGHGAYMQGKAWLAQYLINNAWQQALNSPNKQVKPWFYADSYVTAKLRWPSHKKELTILAGASGRNLAFAPSHFLPSGKFGANNGVLIAGHNDTHFAFLQHVKVGEQFDLQTQNGQIERYKVRDISVIHQSQSEFLNQAGLYLLTCYPFDSLASGTELRLLVSADKVSSSTSMTNS